MELSGKLQPVIIIGSACIGLFLGAFTGSGSIWANGIEFFLMLLLYILFLSVDLKKIRHSFLNFRFTAAAVCLNFIFTPVLAYVLGLLFFSGSLDIRIGLLMLLVTPCTDWYLVFTGLGGGDVELGLSILPLNLVLQIVLLPVYLFVFMGNEAHMDGAAILGSTLFVLLIPFFVSCLTKLWLRRHEKAADFLSRQGDNLQLLFLCLAVICMFASEGENLLRHPLLLIRMFVPLLLFFGILFVLAQLVGRKLKFEKPGIVALNFTTLARNSPLSLAIAVATFPDHPMISLALVIGPLIELPVLSAIAAILRRWNA